MKDFIPSILRRLLAVVAGHLARAHPVRRVPGWWSGLSTTPPLDSERSLRLRFWQTLPNARVRMPWYDGLVLESVFGNDLSHCLYVGGEVDPNEFFFLSEILNAGMTALDVGANEGLYTLFFRRRVGLQGLVIAVEPSKRERARLERNLSLNGFSDVRIVAAALSDRSGSAQLHVAEDDHAGHNTLGGFAAGWVKSARDEAVPLVTLDALVEAQGIRRIDVIKLDIEGAELAALRGAVALLKRDHPILLFEVMEESLQTQGTSAAELLNFVRGLGYALYEFSPETGSPVPLEGSEPQSVNVIAMQRGARRFPAHVTAP
jgi:FkbM family methyltransferase